MKKRILALSMAVLMLAVLSTACTKAPTASKALVMGTNAEFEPFEYREGTDIVGYDVDVATEIAKDYKSTLKIEDMAFDSLVTALAAGKVDMVVAGMSVTDERKKEVDFSNPYYNATQVIIVKKGSTTVAKSADLADKQIGVQEGTTGDLFVSDTANVAGAKVARFKKAVDAALDLKNGKLDAVVLDEKPAQKIVEQNDDLMILDEALTEEEYAIAVKKGNTELLESINKTLEKLEKNGTFTTLKTKYKMAAPAAE